ncbi:MAG TPA: type II toxin-antitoxin system RelE/ParE family toxin [Acidobacteriaceae bacterium]|jgi:addiction module RelE/StbE family toxin|nr:type II toxin-antitoxin system RelE/ParE family toxin [Acidobacteriaceae bacterium]
MEIRWSPLAAEDLEQIRSFIERDNPDAALRVITTIYEGCYRLTDFPYLGRQLSRPAGARQLSFPPLPYVAVYRLRHNRVEIMRIYHAAQNRQ